MPGPPCRPLVGLDAVDVGRLAAALARWPRLAQRLFTEREYGRFARSPGRDLHLAGRFAAKEAVGKLLGCGVTSWREIEVVGAGGAPRVVLHGRARAVALQLGVAEIALSLTHTDTIAAACALAVVWPHGGNPLQE